MINSLRKDAQNPASILLIILTGIFVFVGLRSEINSYNTKLDINRLRFAIYMQCIDVQKSAIGVNVILAELIQGSETSNVFEIPKSTERIEQYKTDMVIVPTCYK